MKIVILINILFGIFTGIYLILSGVKEQFGVHAAEIVAGAMLLAYCIIFPVMEYKGFFKKQP